MTNEAQHLFGYRLPTWVPSFRKGLFTSSAQFSSGFSHQLVEATDVFIGQKPSAQHCCTSLGAHCLLPLFYGIKEQ